MADSSRRGRAKSKPSKKDDAAKKGCTLNGYINNYVICMQQLERVRDQSRTDDPPPPEVMERYRKGDLNFGYYPSSPRDRAWQEFNEKSWPVLATWYTPSLLEARRVGALAPIAAALLECQRAIAELRQAAYDAKDRYDPKFWDTWHRANDAILELDALRPLVLEPISAKTKLEGENLVLRLTWEEASVAARRLLANDDTFATKTAREWADAIGCSAGLVVTLPSWKAIQEGKKKAAGVQKDSSHPPVVSLTKSLEQNVDQSGRLGKAIGASIGATPTPREIALKNLIQESERDAEPSSTDDRLLPPPRINRRRP
ncbi:MAG: hypothetical protein AB7K52_14225 [Phycisphaerales bacterium]